MLVIHMRYLPSGIIRLRGVSYFKTRRGAIQVGLLREISGIKGECSS